MSKYIVYIIINQIIYYSNKEISYEERNIKISKILQRYMRDPNQDVIFAINIILDDEELMPKHKSFIKLQQLFCLISFYLY